MRGRLPPRINFLVAHSAHGLAVIPSTHGFLELALAARSAHPSGKHVSKILPNCPGPFKEHVAVPGDKYRRWYMFD